MVVELIMIIYISNTSSVISSSNRTTDPAPSHFTPSTSPGFDHFSIRITIPKLHPPAPVKRPSAGSKSPPCSMRNISNQDIDPMR